MCRFPQTLMHSFNLHHWPTFRYISKHWHVCKCTYVYHTVQPALLTGQELWYLWCQLCYNGHLNAIVLRATVNRQFTHIVPYSTSNTLRLSFRPGSQQKPHGELYNQDVQDEATGGFCDPASSMCVCASFSTSLCMLAPACVFVWWLWGKWR